MAKAAQKKTGKGRSKSYRFDRKGRIVGPDGKNVAIDDSDTPIVISGGSLQILSAGDLDDDDNPGQVTKQLHSTDMDKHVTSIQLLGFKAGASPNSFVPSNPANPVCTIIIHYG